MPRLESPTSCFCRTWVKAGCDRFFLHQQLPRRIGGQPGGSIHFFRIALTETPMPEVHRGPRQMQQEMFVILQQAQLAVLAQQGLRDAR